jgi:RNA polymerase sigma-70 factor (ECF subfamily)
VRPSKHQPPAAAAQDDEPSDAQLVERSQRGDPAAFEALVTRYRGKVYGLIFNMVRNESDAWDLAQDSFVKAWKALPRFEGQSAFFTWLYRIAHNVALDFLRLRKVEGSVEFDDTVGNDTAAGAVTAPRTVDRPDDQLAQSELGSRIRAALDELSVDHRTIIVLREIEGRSYEEISEILGCSTGTVMSRLFYARKRLQSLLHDVYQSPDWH